MCGVGGEMVKMFVFVCVCVRDILLSSASARRTCKWGSRNRSAASQRGGAPRG